MRDCKQIDKVILVVDHDEFESHYIEKKYNIECVCGGQTRNESIKNALDYIKQNYQCETVLFHDATRPFIKSEFFDECLKAIENSDCVVAYQKITDSLCDSNNNFVERDEYKLIQTPEVFKFDVLYPIFEADSLETTIAGQLKNVSINFIESDKFGFKITYPNDLFLAEQIDKINYYELSKSIETTSSLENKNILIFGATGGVGSALVKTFKQINGVTLLTPKSSEINLNNFSVETLQNFCNDISPDIIINAAAVSYDDSEGIVEKFNETFNVNIKANLIIIKFLKTLNKKTKFIVMSSSSSTKGRENITNYSASKAALNSVVESQSNVLRKQNIYLNAVVPEKINTPMIQKLHKTSISSRELLEVDDVVNAIVHLLTSDSYGQLLHLRKGF